MSVPTIIPANSRIGSLIVTVFWEEKFGCSVPMSRDMTVADVKNWILRKLNFHLAFGLSQTLLVIRSEFNNGQKYASLPYEGNRDDWLLVPEEQKLGDFASDHTTIRVFFFL